MEKDRVKCWDDLHKEKNKGALSACEYQETLDFLRIGDFLESEDKVLEVGPGLGYVTKGLRDNGYSVYALDISPTALKRVKPYCNAVFGFEDLEDIPSNYFDVILCNHVVQHMPTPLMCYELFHFIRVLKKDGVLAVKSVASDLMEDTGDDPELIVQHPKIPRRGGKLRCDESIGCFCRSVACFTKIVDRCGGVAKLVVNDPCDVWCITETHIFHITKKSKEALLV